jgi:hypothetical protein
VGGLFVGLKLKATFEQDVNTVFPITGVGFKVMVKVNGVPGHAPAAPDCGTIV